MKILIFGGTTEGRLLAQALSQQGQPSTVSVATPLGAQELSGLPGVTPLVGRKTADEMAELLKNFDRCVDATHPYAVEASRNIRAACQQAGVPLGRLLRGESSHKEGHWVDSPQEAARWLAERSGNVLLAIGAKGLSAFQDLDRERLYPRVLPVVESIQACQAAGIPTKNIIALHGPFSQELNRAMLEQYHIRYLVTKDGGRAGGFEEKAAAAREAGTELVVIGRPPEAGQTLEEILSWLTQDGKERFPWK